MRRVLGLGRDPSLGDRGGARGTERRRPRTGVSGLWDGEGEAATGLWDPGMETQVWDWVVEIGGAG